MSRGMEKTSRTQKRAKIFPPAPAGGTFFTQNHLKLCRQNPAGTPAGYFGICRSALQLVKLDRLLIAIGRSLIIAETHLVAGRVETKDGSIACDDNAIRFTEGNGIDCVGSSIRELQRILTFGSVNILAVDLERVAVRGLLDRDSNSVQLGAEVILLLAIVAET